MVLECVDCDPHRLIRACAHEEFVYDGLDVFGVLLGWRVELAYVS